MKKPSTNTIAKIQQLFKQTPLDIFDPLNVILLQNSDHQLSDSRDITINGNVVSTKNIGTLQITNGLNLLSLDLLNKDFSEIETAGEITKIKVAWSNMMQEFKNSGFIENTDSKDKQNRLEIIKQNRSKIKLVVNNS